VAENLVIKGFEPLFLFFRYSKVSVFIADLMSKNV